MYKQGITNIIDSFGHTNEKDLSATRDSLKSDMYLNGKLEDEKTPVDELDQPKLLIHKKNEIPLFFGPNKRYLTLDQYYGDYIGEYKIPLKVANFKIFIIHKKTYRVSKKKLKEF